MRPISLPGDFEELLDKYTIISTSNEGWLPELLETLEYDPGIEGGDAEEIEPFFKVLTYAQESLGATTIVVESYISTDWADEYQAWYSRIFREVPRLARRLHFFRSFSSGRELEKKDLLKLESVIASEKNSPYLGYAVLRPLTPPTLAETILLPPPGLDGTVIPCVSNFTPSLLGWKLAITGFPFLQQDKGISVCAQANLWMVARYKHAKSEARRYRPSDMQLAAAKSTRAGAARDGLTDQQMYTAMREMGFNPDIHYPSPGLDNPAGATLDFIAAHVLSKNPVIVACQGNGETHVVTVTGLVTGEDINKISPNAGFNARISHLVCHNDEVGPYLNLEVGKAKVRVGGQKIKGLTVHGWPVLWCLASLPPRVHLRIDDVNALTQEWLNGHLAEVVASEPEGWKQEELEKKSWTTALMKGDEYKGLLSTKYLAGRPRVHRKSFTGLMWARRLPKFVWVAELYDTSAAESRVAGHLVFDATSHFRDIYNSLLGVVVNGRGLVREEGKDWALTGTTKDEQSYPRLLPTP